MKKGLTLTNADTACQSIAEEIRLCAKTANNLPAHVGVGGAAQLPCVSTLSVL